jgi:hypothetical protein
LPDRYQSRAALKPVNAAARAKIMLMIRTYAHHGSVLPDDMGSALSPTRAIGQNVLCSPAAIRAAG